MKFQPGDRVVIIEDKHLLSLRNGTIITIEKEEFAFGIDEVRYWGNSDAGISVLLYPSEIVSEEIYNSPLFKALQED
jgi:hypothetical protein